MSLDDFLLHTAALGRRTTEQGMIRRQHLVSDFFDEAEAMREALDARFKDAYTDGIPWYYFCDPRMYTYLRAAPQNALPERLLERFMQRLRSWCMDNLGLTPMGLPYLHLMVNGCRLGLHSDFHNGVWGYVYSLTRWAQRKFSGGETLLLRDGIPSYKKHHVHGEVLYELIPAQFNQLLVFDDRIVHATPAIEGSMDPSDGRIALVGHIRATSPVVNGSIRADDARKSVLEVLAVLRDQLRSYKDVQGTITFRLEVRPIGTVESVTTLTDNLITQLSGYDHSDSVATVKSLIDQTLTRITFSAAAGRSSIVLPLLLPVPDLRPLEFSLGHHLSISAVREWVTTHLSDAGGSSLQGSWEGDTFVVQEPIAGSMRIDGRQIAFHFDAPMWVPSQRDRFQTELSDWARRAPA